MVCPVLVLDIDRPAGVILLELRVGGGNEIRPAGLRIDLEPHGQLVRLSPVDSRARSRRHDPERYGRDGR
jgi:hypothetical protein